ncbi:uncharacterized protein LOC143018131 isoform X3 [Oratosquilla oratoria]|uniref:uncharacterized protein LOC143018131 isoform X3 n=1 Tax=Oratosquilla oratoria TaxID=337810 RepID=UPI003F7693C9
MTPLSPRISPYMSTDSLCFANTTVGSISLESRRSTVRSSQTTMNSLFVLLLALPAVLGGQVKSICEDGYFSCGDGSCIHDRFKCNDFPDCPDLSDESSCTECMDGKFLCPSGYCIPDYYVCDGYIDCVGQPADEENCEGHTCGKNHTTCKDGNCVHDNFFCDGFYDCSDFEDEAECDACQPGSFLCAAVQECWTLDALCDGWWDCSDGGDEMNCDTCINGHFHCQENVCIDSTWVCDGIGECINNEDEDNCLEIRSSISPEEKQKLKMTKERKRRYL